MTVTRILPSVIYLRYVSYHCVSNTFPKFCMLLERDDGILTVEWYGTSILTWRWGRTTRPIGDWPTRHNDNPAPKERILYQLHRRRDGRRRGRPIKLLSRGGCVVVPMLLIINLGLILLKKNADGVRNIYRWWSWPRRERTQTRLHSRAGVNESIDRARVKIRTQISLCAPSCWE